MGPQVEVHGRIRVHRTTLGGGDVTATTDQGRLAGPLSVSVANLCRRLQPQVSARTAAGFAEVLRRLGAPLQVAVAGRIKSGKSTLVNALIGRRVAPTDVGECTRLVTRFQYGTVDRIEIVFNSGNKQVLPFAPDGSIPAELGVDTSEVSHLEAYLTSAVLQDMTVIDTPGLGSLDAASVSRTEQLLGAAQNADGEGDELDETSRSAVAGAEAVLYVVTQGVRADDQQALAAFTAATGAARRARSTRSPCSTRPTPWRRSRSRAPTATCGRPRRSSPGSRASCSNRGWPTCCR